MSTERPKTRDELYERIRQGSKTEFILEDMIRLGFWPERGVWVSEGRILTDDQREKFRSLSGKRPLPNREREILDLLEPVVNVPLDDKEE